MYACKYFFFFLIYINAYVFLTSITHRYNESNFRMLYIFGKNASFLIIKNSLCLFLVARVITQLLIHKSIFRML